MKFVMDNICYIKDKICYNFACSGLKIILAQPLIRYSCFCYIYIRQFSIIGFFENFSRARIRICYCRIFAISLYVIFESWCVYSLYLQELYFSICRTSSYNMAAGKFGPLYLLKRQKSNEIKWPVSVCNSKSLDHL